MPHNSWIEVAACNYAIHDKPFRSQKIHVGYLLRLQMEGAARVCLNGTAHHLRPGDLLLCRPGDEYELTIEPDSPNAALRSADYFVYCHGEWVERWWDPSLPRRMHIGMNEQIVTLFKSIVHEKRRLLEHDPEIQDGLARLLLLSVKRLAGNGAFFAPKAYLPYRMKDYIERNAAEKLTLEGIAAYAGLGVSRASELFKATFGTSLMAYVIELRLNMARERMLYDDATLEEISYACGFRTYTHFSRMFRSRYGMSPKEYERNNKVL